MNEAEWATQEDVRVFTSVHGDKVSVDNRDLPQILASGYEIRVASASTRHRSVGLVTNVLGRKKCIPLGRFLLEPTGKQVVLHVNRNPCDNTRKNLRIAPTVGMRRRDYMAEAGVISIKSKRGHVLIDEADGAILSTFSITVARRKKDAYLVARARPYDRKSAGTTLGRIILGASPGQFVDHINHDTLDNRRSNLRLGSYAQNCWNVRPRKAGLYKGVCRTVTKNGGVRWRAQVQAGGVLYRLGYYATPEEAARAFDAGARKHQGEFAFLNFP